MKEITIKLDVARKDKQQFTSAGFLVVDANLTRAGVFDYYEDGKLSRELRSPEEVFKQSSLDSLQFAPITRQHPKNMVNTDNAKQVQVGSVGENITRKGDFVTSKIVINDKKEIEAILAKWDRGEEAELSMGYQAELKDISGTHHIDGDYDKIQTNIIYNHASIVDKGRAGANVKLIRDAVDEIEKLNDKKTEVSMFKFKRDKIEAGKFKMDSVMEEIEDGAKGVVVALSDKIDEATIVILDMQKDHDELQAKHDEVVESGKKLQSKVDELSDPASTVVQDMIQARSALESIAGQVDIKVAHEDGKPLDSKSLKLAIITKVHPEFKSDEKSDDYIGARFDAVVEFLSVDKTDKSASSLGKFISDAEGNKGKAKKDARDNYLEGIKDYHKKKAA